MIRIYKGDDTDFGDIGKVVVSIDTALDLTGYTGSFCLLGVVRTFTAEEIATKSVVVSYSAEETARFVPGLSYGVFTLRDPKGRRAAVSKVLVAVCIHRPCGCPDDASGISISIDNLFDYTVAVGKPSINGVTVEGDRDAAYYDLATQSALDTKVPKAAFVEFDGIAAPSASLSSLKTCVTKILSIMKGLGA